MIKPEIKLNGWQTAKSYANSKGWQTNKYVYQLIRDEKLESMRVPDINNVLLVKEKSQQ